VRGPDQVDDDYGFSLPYEENLESVATAEPVLDDLNVLEGSHKVAAIREIGGLSSGDKDSTMQPRLPSTTIASVYQLEEEQADHYVDHHGALDVDSYAEALLDELGVTENYMDSLARKLAANATKKKRKGFVSAEKLAQNWGIGKEAARRTVESTTQPAVRDLKHMRGGRRLKPNAWMLRYPRRDAKVYSDTWFARVKSLRGNTCAQVYGTDFHFVKAVAMESKKDAYYSLEEFFRLCWIPAALIPDNAKELTQGIFAKTAKRFSCPILPAESYTPDANAAKDAIRELIRMYTRKMIEKAVPEVLWDYCFEWCSLVRTFTALKLKSLGGRTPYAVMTGETPDISFLAEFGFYDWVWHITPAEKGLQRKRLGRYLGPALNHGDAMCGFVLRETGKVVDRSSIIPLSEEELRSESIKELQAKFTAKLEGTLKSRAKAIDSGKQPDVVADGDDESFSRPLVDPTPIHVPYEQWDLQELRKEFGLQSGDFEEDAKAPLPDIAEADDVDYDGLIAAKVKLPRDGHTFVVGKVVRRARDENGELIGKVSNNPFLNTAVYEIQFDDDGPVERYHANAIAEHIFSQVDVDGYGVSMLDEIIAHRMGRDALRRHQAVYTDKHGN
jgi:hypothetical protein